MPIKANGESSLLNLSGLPNLLEFLITKKPTAKVKPLLRAFDIAYCVAATLVRTMEFSLNGVFHDLSTTQEWQYCQLRFGHAIQN